MSEFFPAFDFAMQHEDASRSGRVTQDAGGRTRFGIAAKFHPELPESFFTGPAEAALKTAEEILRRDYWQPMRLAELREQTPANKLFDMGVNMGVRQAAIYAQRAVNGLIVDAQALATNGQSGRNGRDGLDGHDAEAGEQASSESSLSGGAQAPGPPARDGFPRDGVEVLLPATCIAEDGVIGEHTLAALNAADPPKLYALLCEWSRRHYEHVVAINPAQAKNLSGWLKRADA